MKCVGLFGKIFGHKFFQDAGDTRYTMAHCQRCGMPKGGWPS